MEMSSSTGFFHFHANQGKVIFMIWPAPLYSLYFNLFLSICTSFVVRTRGIVFVVYLLSRLANNIL